VQLDEEVEQERQVRSAAHHVEIRDPNVMDSFRAHRLRKQKASTAPCNEHSEHREAAQQAHRENVLESRLGPHDDRLQALRVVLIESEERAAIRPSQSDNPNIKQQVRHKGRMEWRQTGQRAEAYPLAHGKQQRQQQPAGAEERKGGSERRQQTGAQGERLASRR
jgi:hypothetical protein